DEFWTSASPSVTARKVRTSGSAPSRGSAPTARSTSRSRLPTPRPCAPSGTRPWSWGRRGSTSHGCGRSTTRTTTAHSSVTRTATTSRRSATPEPTDSRARAALLDATPADKGPARERSGDLEDELAGVAALEESEQGASEVLDTALDDRLARDELTGGDEACQVRQRGLVLVRVVEDEEAVHPRPDEEQRHVAAGSVRELVLVVA